MVFEIEGWGTEAASKIQRGCLKVLDYPAGEVVNTVCVMCMCGILAACVKSMCVSVFVLVWYKG